MPVLVGLGAVSWWEFLASAVISVVCTLGVARLASVIYRRAILRTGAHVELRDILGRTATSEAVAPVDPLHNTGNPCRVGVVLTQQGRLRVAAVTVVLGGGTMS